MFEVEIAKGAKLLDEDKSDWLDLIDLKKLDLADPCNCIIGQSFPNDWYIDALLDLFADSNETNVCNDSDNHGFATADCSNYHILTQEWKDYIQKRRLQKVGG